MKAKGTPTPLNCPCRLNERVGGKNVLAFYKSTLMHASNIPDIRGPDFSHPGEHFDGRQA